MNCVYVFHNIAVINEKIQTMQIILAFFLLFVVVPNLDVHSAAIVQMWEKGSEIKFCEMWFDEGDKTETGVTNASDAIDGNDWDWHLTLKCDT